VLAVTHGLISRDEALRRYGLSEDEFDAWCSAIAMHGKAALRTTALQRYRQPRTIPATSAATAQRAPFP